MTVETTISKAGPYAGAGTVGPFPVPFRFLDATHLQVTRTDASGVNTVLALGSDYSVAGVGNLTGSVTLTLPLSNGFKLTVLRNVPATQEADYVQNDAFPAESHEQALDKLTMLAQQQAERVGRALVVPETDAPVSLTLPSASARARRYLSFDADGRPVSTTFDIDAVQEASQAAQDAAAASSVSENNAATSAANAAASAEFARDQSDFVKDQVAATTPTVVRFSGDGVETTFPLPSVPGAEENTLVYISGAYQQKNIYDIPAGTSSLVFSEAPPVGTENIEVVIAPSVMLSISDAQDMSFVGPDGIKRNVGYYLRDAVSRVSIPFTDYAAASASAVTLPDGQHVEVGADESLDGRRTLYEASAGTLVFVRFSDVARPGAGTVTDDSVAPNAGVKATKLAYEDNRAPTYLKTVSDVLNGLEVSVYRFLPTDKHGAIAARTDTTDYAANLQDAFNAFIYGGGLSFEYGRIMIGSGIHITKPVSIRGKGMWSEIAPLATFPDNQDMLVYSPDPNFGGGQIAIRDIAIGEGNINTPRGRTVIFLDTQAEGQGLHDLDWRNVYLGAAKYRSLWHLNNSANNPNGGLYTSVFDNIAVRAGVRLEGSGDSNRLLNLKASGLNCGLEYSLVSGASQLVISNANITSAGGCIRGYAGSRVRIENGNFESFTDASNPYMIDLDGSSGTMLFPEIIHCHFGAFGSADVTHAIRMNNCVGGYIGGRNTFLNERAGRKAALITNSNDCQIGWNDYGNGIDKTTPIEDSGTGTIGITKSLTLLGNAQNYDPVNYGVARATKSEDGFVQVEGAIRGYTNTAGVPVAILPVGLRPAKAELFVVPVSAGGGNFGVVQVQSDGNIVIQTSPGNDYMGLGPIRFRAAKHYSDIEL